MSTLFINAKLIDPEAGTETLGALFVADGVINEVLTQAPENIEMFRMRNKSATVVDCGGKHLAPGIVDIGVKVCEPGERHKESFRTAGQAAAAGGVTTMVTRPDTTPDHRQPRDAGIRHPARARSGPRQRAPHGRPDQRPRGAK